MPLQQLPTRGDMMRVRYALGSRDMYTGMFEKFDEKNQTVTLKLVSETDDKGKPCYRSFKLDKLEILFCSGKPV